MNQVMKSAVLSLAVLMMAGGCTARPSRPASAQPEQSDSPGSLYSDSRQEVTVQMADSASEPDKEDKREEKQEEENEQPGISAIEIGELDRAPMRFQDQGWVVRQNGKFGYLNKEGQWVIRPKFDTMQFTSFGDEDSLYTVVLYDHDKDSRLGAFLPYTYIPEDLGYGIGGAMRPEYYALNDSHNVQLVAPNGVTSQDPQVPRYPFTIYDVSVSLEEMKNSDYWIWYAPIAASYGPYSPDSPPSFLLEADRFGDQHDSGMSTVQDYRNTAAGSLFWIPADETMGLISMPSGRIVDGFTVTDNIEIGVCGGMRNGVYEVYDSGLNRLYATKFDAGAAPIDNLVPVKDGNTWVLASFEEVSGASSVSSAAPAMDVQDGGVVSEEEKQVGLYSTPYEMNVRSEPDYDGASAYLMDAGTHFHVSELQKGSNASLWGKLGPNRWICLYDAGTLYCHSVPAPDHFIEGIIDDMVAEHYRALQVPEIGTIRSVSLWKEKNSVARVMLECDAGTIGVSVDFKTGHVEDDNGWDSWSFE